jgi:hypothetical protein
MVCSQPWSAPWQINAPCWQINHIDVTTLYGWNLIRVGACEFPHGNGTCGPTKWTPGLNAANYSDCTAALVTALEVEEEKNLIWVMQVNRP